MQRVLLLVLVSFLGSCAKFSQPPSSSTGSDAAFEKIAHEYIKGFLDWRPQTGTALGFHVYDGKVTDLSSASLNQELARLKDFDTRLSAISVETLSPKKAYEYRILQSAIDR